MDLSQHRLALPLVTALAVVVGWVLAMPAHGMANSVAGFHRIAIDSSPDFSNLNRTAERHQYVVLQAWQADKMRAMKAANPNLKVLVYKNLSASIASSNNGLRSTGVSYQEANEEHPEWFLRNRAGERFTFRSFPYLWAMDVGSASYQRRWADNVIAELVREGWDGVFMDDTNTTMKYHYSVQDIAKYPSDSAWQEATRSALAHIGPRIQDAGKLVVPNIGSWGEYPSVGRNWLQYVTGAMDEMFVKWGSSAGDGYAYEGRWSAQLQSLEAAQQRGKHFIAVSHSSNTDRQAARYGWATVLLGAEGKASFALHADYTHETWFPEYEYDLGNPTGDRTQLSNGLQMRKFERGLVVVNPTDSAAATDLPGSYSGSGFDSVTRVRLEPKRAAILLRDQGPETPDEPGNDGDAPGDDEGSGGDEAPEAGDGEGTGTPSPKPRGKSLVRGKRSVQGGKVIVTGRLRSVQPRALAGSQPRLRMYLKRRGRVYRSGRVAVRRDGRFVGRVRACKRGRYRVHVVDLSSGERLDWPRPVKVSKRNKKRC